MASCYILFSTSLRKYYVGCTQTSAEERLERHNTSHFGRHFTSQVNDWELFLDLKCQSFPQARSIEIHLKKMKSRKYFEDLKKYPEMVEKLKARFINCEIDL